MVSCPLLAPPPVAKSVGNSVEVVLSLINPLGIPMASSEETLPKLLPAPESAIQSTQNVEDDVRSEIWVRATLECNTGTTPSNFHWLSWLAPMELWFQSSLNHQN